MSWHSERFIEKEGRVRFDCIGCGTPMWFPPTKAGKYKTCGEKCSTAQREKVRASRERACLGCGRSFVPRPAQIANGGGKYCSVQCSIRAAAEFANTSEVRQRIAETLRRGHRNGSIKRPSGPAHVQWKGGRKARNVRNREANARRAREWRRANPELAREKVSRRRGKVRVNLLPRGTIARIGTAQRWRCTVCGVNVRRKYHVDHVVPLARGGEHVPSNLQLLCPPCNLAKNAKDPIAFMQERGFLL